MTLTVAGSSPAMPRPGSASSAYLLRHGETAVVFDLGSGALGKLQLSVDVGRLDAIVISHVHADHFFDLVPLRYGLKYGAVSRQDRLAVWLPPGGGAALDALRRAVSPDAPADFFDSVFAIAEYDPAQVLRVGDFRLSFCGTRHFIEAYAVRADSGGSSVVYSADTAPCDDLVELATGSTLFLCEAALGLGSENGRRGHSSAYEAGEMAARAGAGHLVLTHYPAQCDAQLLVDAARSHFDGAVSVATDGATIAVVPS
jgi:ribonuclease BN (tRNA processing enzyme)